MASNNRYEKKQKQTWKTYVSLLHLWLGLASGSIVFIIAITGCIFVFQDEVKDALHDWRFVTPQEATFKAPSILLKTVTTLHPDATPDMVVYHKENRPATVYIERRGIPYLVHLNPYSGEITHLQNLDTDFFMVVERLHRFLLLPEEIGKQVTGVATFIFLTMLITGLILWWPKKWKNASQNFKVKWGARWRRKNYDWHRVTGFYMILPAIVVATTGLAFTYEWVNDGLFKVGNVINDHPVFKEPAAFKNVASTKNSALDTSLSVTQELMPDSGMLFVWNQGNGLPIVTGAYPEALDFDHQSNFYFHPETGELIASQYYESKNTGTQLQEMNYGLHTGQYLGIFGKTMAFIASLFVASLPVSGFVIWYGRRKKKTSKIRNKLFV